MKTLEKKEYYILKYNELDKIVNEIFPSAEFECTAMWEWSNDEEHTFDNVKNKLTPLCIGTDGRAIYLCDEDDLKDVEESLSSSKWRPYAFSLYDLLMYLCIHDIIPEGNYMIEVDW